MEKMVWFTVLATSLSVVFQLGRAGSPCPMFTGIRPCYCSRTDEIQTLMICSGLQTSSELQKVTESMKSMLIDKFILFGSFQPKRKAGPNMEDNEIEPVADNITIDARLPKEWLTSLRVKEIDIQDTSFSSCFLCDHPFIGQDEYLSTFVVKHSSLEGHLCSVCNTKIRHVSTKELSKMSQLRSVDFSYNRIKLISGYGFPALPLLSTIDLSNNEITSINDNAFSNLASITELDLSRNRLSILSRKIFHPDGTSLKSLDLSWNSIETISEDAFEKLRSIKEIRLNHNLLTVLHESTWKRLPLMVERIDVNGNFLTCNCSLSWVVNKMHKNTKLSGKCVGSRNLGFQDIKPALAALPECK